MSAAMDPRTVKVLDPGTPATPATPASTDLMLDMRGGESDKSCGKFGKMLIQLVHPDRPPVPAIPGRANVMCFKNPREIVHAICAGAVAKAKLPFIDMFVLAILSGAYVGLGATFALTIRGGCPGCDKGLKAILYGGTFPVGLMLVIICGSELFTGNTAAFVRGVVSGKVSAWECAKNLIFVYFGNLVGSLLVAYFLAYQTDLWGLDPYHAELMAIVKSKLGLPFGVCVLRAIGCNWLVNLAVWICVSAEDIASKVWGAWFPIMAFAAIGYEHCVANMFLLPVGLMYGAEGTTTDIIAKNLVPATIGNIIGGSFMVGCIYTFLYLRPTPGAGAGK